MKGNNMRQPYFAFGKLKPVFAALSLLMLAGCATFSSDGGMDDVSAMTKERIGQPVQRVDTDAIDIESTVRQLLSEPLTADTAMRIALLNNRSLLASLAELGVAEADLVQAGRLRNPGFTFSRLRGGEDVEIERSVLFDLVGLLTIPLRTKFEQRRFELAKWQAASHAVRVAGDARRAYFNAIAAQQAAAYMEQVATAAEAGAELGRRMAQVGNWSRLDQAREQAFYADAVAQLARARHNAVSAREQLTKMLGLWGNDVVFKLPERLPELPSAANVITDIERAAMQQRLDVQMAKRETEATASALGLTKATGFINVFEAGYINKSETGKARSNGYEIELALPIFDWGGARNAKAEAIYRQSVLRTADTAIRARSEVREAYSAYRTAYDLARHYRDEVVPLRKKISEELLLRYNGMLASVFELLADSRAQIGSVNAAIEAQRDFWLADTHLQMAVNGSGNVMMQLRGSATVTETSAGH